LKNIHELKHLVARVEHHNLFFGIFKFLSIQFSLHPTFFESFDKLLGPPTENPTTLYIFGICYHIGIGFKQNPEKAVQYYRKASSMNHSISLNNLAFCYDTGFGVEKNMHTAFHLYEKSANLGYPTAIYNLSRCYSSGEGVSKDPKIAFQLLKKSVKLGDPRGINNLGICYENGEGTKINIKLAVYWFKTGDKYGDDYCRINLARCYEYAIGVEKNYTLSSKLYHKAVKSDLPFSYFNLFRIYSFGQGVKRNLDVAFTNLKKISKSESCNNVLHDYGLFCLFGEKNEVDAVLSFQKSSNICSTFWYGFCLFLGIGCQKRVLDGLELMKNVENTFQISEVFLSSNYPRKLAFL
jgi:TPR repeat protein